MHAKIFAGVFGCLLAAAATANAHAAGEKQEPASATNFTESPVKAPISGRVQFPGGVMPSEPVRIRLETHTGRLLEQVTAGTGGFFTFNHVNCGFYVLAVDVAGYRPVRMPLEHSFIPAEGLQLALRDTAAEVAPPDPVPAKANREYARGMSHAANNREPEALAAFERAIRIYPGFHDAYAEVAQMHLQRKNLVAAREVLERAMRGDAANPRILLMLGRTARLQGEPARAIEVLGRSLEKHEASWVARWEMAEALAALARFDEAAGHIARAHELNPSVPAIHQLHYNTMIRRSQYGEALTELDEFLRLFPAHPLTSKARQQRAALALRVASESSAPAASPVAKNP